MKIILNRVLILIACVLFLTGCEKIARNQLLGKWKVAPVEDVDTEYYEYWTFSADGVLYIEKTTVEYTGGEITATGIFKMKDRKTFVITGISDGHLLGYNTKWEIYKFTDNVLRVCSQTAEQGGLIFKEFTKEN